MYIALSRTTIYDFTFYEDGLRNNSDIFLKNLRMNEKKRFKKGIQTQLMS